MAVTAEGLPIAEFVPKQNRIATVRPDVIDDGAGDDEAEFATAGSDRREAARAIATQRIEGAKGGGAFVPTGRVPAFRRRPAIDVAAPAMGRTVAARDADGTLRPDAIPHNLEPAQVGVDRVEFAAEFAASGVGGVAVK